MSTIQSMIPITPRRAAVSAALVALMSIASAAVAATVDPVKSDERPGARDSIKVLEKAAPGVHVMKLPRTVFTGVVGNVTIIEQWDGVVLVDTGSSHGAGRRVVEAVKSLTAKPVKAVVITHWHNDHPLGLSAIVAEWPDADIISTEETKADMEAGRLGDIPRTQTAEYDEQRTALLRGYIPQFSPNITDPALSEEEQRDWARAIASIDVRIEDAPGTYLVLPKTTFVERFDIPDKKAPIEILFLGRANTSGDLSVWLPKQRVLIAGDAVVEPIPYMFNMFPSEQIEVLQKMKEIDFKILVPGHGELQTDEAYLDKLIGFIGNVQEQIAPLAEQGLSLEEATAKADFTVQKNAFAGESKWLAYWFDLYALTPLIDSVYREAKGEPLGSPPLQQ